MRPNHPCPTGRFRLSSTLRLLPLALGCAAISAAHAADDFWNVAGPAPWTDDLNWSLGLAPTGADNAVIANGGEATVANGDTITIGNLRFVDGTLTMTGGSITNSTSELRIGDYAFSATPGTANLNMSGTSSITAQGRLYIADGNGTGSTVSTANLTLDGDATISNNNDYLVIGRQGGDATVVLNDNAKIQKNGATNRMILADGASGIADVTLNDSSSLVASAGRIELGGGGTSTVTMNGDSELNTVDGEIWIGTGSTTNSTVTVSGNSTLTKGGASGYLTVARADSTAELIVEQFGKVVSENHLRLGEGANADATVTLRDNAIVEVATRLDMEGGATVNLSMSDNATMTIFGNETTAIGRRNGSQVDFQLSNDAAILATNTKWKVGDYGGAVTDIGNAAITLNNDSELALREMTIGHIGGPTATATVTVNDSATLTVSDFITLGRDDDTTNNGMNGRLILNGGTVATSSIRQGGIAAGAEPDATRNNITANGGTIQALADEADFFQATANNANRPYVQIDAGGLTFDTQNFNVGIQTVLHGTGDFTKIGGGILTLDGAQDYTGDTLVVDGTLSINTAYLADLSSVYLYTGATLDLAFVGTDTIGFLFIDDVLQANGIYDSNNLGAFLSGTGSLTVVPEPSTYALSTVALLGLAVLLRRKRLVS